MSERRRGPLDPNVAAAFAYVLGPLSGLIVLLFSRSLVSEREPFVRFHAKQSVLTFTAVAVLQLALRSLPIVGVFAGVPFVLAVLLLWGMLIVRALMGQLYKLPVIGEMAGGHILN